MGCFSRTSLWLTPRPGQTRAGAKQPTPYHFSTDPPQVPCNLVPPDSLPSSRHGVATWGQDAKTAKIAISGGRPGLAFVAISSSQVLIHGP